MLGYLRFLLSCFAQSGFSGDGLVRRVIFSLIAPVANLVQFQKYLTLLQGVLYLAILLGADYEVATRRDATDATRIPEDDEERRQADGEKKIFMGADMSLSGPDLLGVSDFNMKHVLASPGEIALLERAVDGHETDEPWSQLVSDEDKDQSIASEVPVLPVLFEDGCRTEPCHKLERDVETAHGMAKSSSDVTSTYGSQFRHWSGLHTEHATEEGLRLRLPELPAEAQERYVSSDCQEFEREIIELYIRFSQHVESEGFNEHDVKGPLSFEHVVEAFRVRVEAAFIKAKSRSATARRLAVSGAVDAARGLGLLVQAEERIEKLLLAKRAHDMVRRTWKKAHKAMRMAADGELEARQYKQFVADRLASSREEGTRLPTPHVCHPCIGILEAMPTDVLRKRTPPDLPTSVDGKLYDVRSREWETERVYDELQLRCARGELCVVHCFYFLRTMEDERTVLSNMGPCRERVWRAAAFNRLVNFWKHSFPAKETEAHKEHMARTDKILLHSSRPEVPGARDLLMMLYKECGGVLRDDQSSCSAEGVGLELALQPEKKSSLSNVSSSTVAEPLDAQDEKEPLETAATVGMRSVLDAPSDACSYPGASSIGGLDSMYFVHDSQGVCVSCLERPATQVAKSCGHLVYCKTCQRKAILNVLRKGVRRTATARPYGVNKKEFERTKLACPICRKEGVMVARQAFDGAMYNV